MENAGYRWAYHALAFGVLCASAYRSFVLRETTWDLMAMVVLSGVMNAAYQASHRVLYPRWVVMTVVTLVTAAALAAGMVLFLGRGR